MHTILHDFRDTGADRAILSPGIAGLKTCWEQFGDNQSMRYFLKEKEPKTLGNPLYSLGQNKD